MKIIKILGYNNFDKIQSILFKLGYKWNSLNPLEIKDGIFVDYIILNFPFIFQCSEIMFNFFNKNVFEYFNNFNEFENYIRKSKLNKILNE